MFKKKHFSVGQIVWINSNENIPMIGRITKIQHGKATIENVVTVEALDSHNSRLVELGKQKHSLRMLQKNPPEQHLRVYKRFFSYIKPKAERIRILSSGRKAC